MKFFLPVAIVALSALPAFAEPIIYQPVQYQYGQHGEIFYGGQNPNFLANPYVFTPGVPLNAGLPIAPAPAAIAPLVQHLGGPSASYRFERFDARNIHGLPSTYYSDLMPYTEVGQYGFTTSDARNEAYLNVPRYQVKESPTPAPAEPVVAPASPAQPAAVTDVKAKAIPLLTWAKGAHSRGETELEKALLQEANKYDPEATAKVRADLK